MSDADADILRWCVENPPDTEQVYNVLCRSDGKFRDDEGPYWDFKQEFPFSMSDDYFAGIARSLFAFSNTFGGVLIFGVHDKLRIGGHNKVTINFDKFRKALQQLSDAEIPVTIEFYAIHTRKHRCRIYLSKTKERPPVQISDQAGKI